MIQKTGFIMCYMVLYSHCTGFRIPLNLPKLMELLSFIVCFDSFWRFWAVKSTWFKVFQECSRKKNNFGSQNPVFFCKKRMFKNESRSVFSPFRFFGRKNESCLVCWTFPLGTSWCKSLGFSFIFCINPFTSLGFASQAMQIEEIGGVCFSYLKW